MHPIVLDVDEDPNGADLNVLRAPRSGNRSPSVWLAWAERLAAWL
jgi:hypothetical protein